jgi:hypothetical protein
LRRTAGKTFLDLPPIQPRFGRQREPHEVEAVAQPTGFVAQRFADGCDRPSAWADERTVEKIAIVLYCIDLIFAEEGNG